MQESSKNCQEKIVVLCITLLLVYHSHDLTTIRHYQKQNLVINSTFSDLVIVGSREEVEDASAAEAVTVDAPDPVIVHVSLTIVGDVVHHHPEEVVVFPDRSAVTLCHSRPKLHRPKMPEWI